MGLFASALGVQELPQSSLTAPELLGQGLDQNTEAIRIVLEGPLILDVNFNRPSRVMPMASGTLPPREVVPPQDLGAEYEEILQSAGPKEK